jgi:acyl-CoA reductase-like NAD-dependent aldehyde dehydrogenase
VAFTGSTITGRKIMEAAAKSNLKKVGGIESLVHIIDAIDAH